jgi:hypothetical protein
MNRRLGRFGLLSSVALILGGNLPEAHALEAADSEPAAAKIEGYFATITGQSVISLRLPQWLTTESGTPPTRYPRTP